MVDTETSLFQLVLASFFIINQIGVCSSEGTGCLAREEVLTTFDGYTPEVVSRYRCSGRDPSVADLNQQCVAVVKKTVKKILTYPGYPDKVFSFETHHGECRMACVCDLNGHKCDDETQAPTCQQGLSWNKKMCKCVPNALDCGAVTHKVIGKDSH